MTHERPCCGQACTCDGEDTWNEPEVCIVSDDDCGQCRAESEMDDMDDFPATPDPNCSCDEDKCAYCQTGILPGCDPHREGDPGCVPALDAHTSACCIRRGIPLLPVRIEAERKVPE